MRYVAFLRAINVGGRVVRMDALRRLFQSAGLKNVETFIASGNVIFDSSARNTTRLERTLEERLQAALGYPVATFLRPITELASLVEHPRFAEVAPHEGSNLYIAFLRAQPSAECARKLRALSNEIDDLQVHERQILWLCRGAFRDSTLSGSALERTAGMPATVRNATTVRKLVLKLT